MRVNSALVTLLLLLVTLTPVILLEDVPQTDVESEFSQDVRSSSERAITYSVSPADGWTTGGEEITITGTGFLDMAYKNVTSDGEAYTWTTTTASYVTSAVGILPSESTQMEPFTSSTQIRTVMIFGTAVMMVQHGRIRKSETVLHAVMRISLLTAMITYTSLTITLYRAQDTSSIPCMMEHHGQITGAGPALRTTKFP